jgi:hypothetical protein
MRSGSCAMSDAMMRTMALSRRVIAMPSHSPYLRTLRITCRSMVMASKRKSPTNRPGFGSGTYGALRRKVPQPVVLSSPYGMCRLISPWLTCKRARL